MFSHREKRNGAQKDYNLAQQYYYQQKYSEAETLLRKSAQEFENLFGAEHRGTLDSKLLLARTVYDQQKYYEAETLLQKLAQEFEKVKGIGYRGTLDSKFLFARAVYNQQQYAKAETLFQKSVQDLEEVLVFRQQQYAKAETLFQKLVQGFEKALGAEHRDTLDSKFCLAQTVFGQQQYAKAETLFQESVQELEKVLGAEQKDTLYSKFYLARAVYEQNQYDKAETLFQKLVQEQEKVLGAEHNDTLNSKSWLKQTIYKKNQYAETSQPLPELSATSLLSIQTLAETVANRLGEYFGADGGGRAQYTDFDIARISLLLKQSNLEWSKVPRIYIILRTIGCLSHLDTFIDLGFSDYWLPFKERSLPHCVRPSQRSQFVATQNIAMTQSLDLEKGAAGQHCNFSQREVLPFKEKGIIGSGGYGQVDKVLNLVSFKEYARKRVNRHMAFGRRTEDLQSFIAEIEILKRLNHHHIVEFVGSYTDPRFMGLIMSPVADMDLSTYLQGVDTSRHMELRTFFGCLARALEFLHEQKVRHKDIKPSNILLHHGKILFTDFGLSLDFTDAKGSTTVSMVNGMTPKYCAPEVAMFESRNTSSDIWSLGVVFLEMIACLKGRTVEYMYQFLAEHGSRKALIRTNPGALSEFVAELRGMGNPADNAALGWVEDMLLVQQDLRPTASSLVASTISSGKEGEKKVAFCGICCVSRHDDFLDEADEPENN
ncbi:hypothetical protein ACLOAV_005508 [Pseudogymnoascus australis]